MSKTKYRAYLNSAHWRNLRKIVLERDNHTCTKCGVKGWPGDRLDHNMHVHHLRYRKDLSLTVPDDLITLCRPCHERHHRHKSEDRKIRRFLRTLAACIILAGCSSAPITERSAPVAAHAPASPVPLPPLPSTFLKSGRAHAALSMTGGVTVVVMSTGYVSFQYPTNVCTVLWQLQGSSDLQNWVNIGDPYAVGCPSGDLEVMSTNPCYFYRLKGTQ